MGHDLGIGAGIASKVTCKSKKEQDMKWHGEIDPSVQRALFILVVLICLFGAAGVEQIMAWIGG